MKTREFAFKIFQPLISILSLGIIPPIIVQKIPYFSLNNFYSQEKHGSLLLFYRGVSEGGGAEGAIAAAPLFGKIEGAAAAAPHF